MKVCCILGSPRKNGNTARIVGEITRGLQENGCEIKTFILPELAVNYCLGDKSCYQTGVCIQRDDVAKIVEEMLDSQIVLVASPSYWGDVTAQMKTFIDRCTPYGSENPARKIRTTGTRGVAVAVRAGGNKKENENLVHTIEHFLGHLEIPLAASFTAEGVDTIEDLENHPEILQRAYHFGNSLTV
jgi:multimeric flavodoxin WrbA